jgi:serine/threonine-protein kinase
VLFLSERTRSIGVYRRSADGTGTDEMIAHGDRTLAEIVATRDGRWLVARTSGGNAGAGDIVALEIGRDSIFHSLIATPASETSPAVSPDGHWIAYASTMSGRREVYVRPFPNVNDGLWQVSTSGAAEPRWSHSGKEIFFRDISSLALLSATVETQPVFHASTPRVLSHTDAATGVDHPRYDVALDDNHFLIAGFGSTRVQPQMVRAENLVQSSLRRGR